MTWLPRFQHPGRVDLGAGYHLRPIRKSDVDIDYPAVMGSRERLWSIYGVAWRWPSSTMTLEEDRLDLARHEREMEAGGSFNYAILDEPEHRLLGCVYLDPSPEPEHDAVVSWWVIDEMVGTELDLRLRDFVPAWIEKSWPFTKVHFGV